MLYTRHAWFVYLLADSSGNRLVVVRCGILCWVVGNNGTFWKGRKMNIKLGALCPSISEQLEKQGLEQIGKSIELLDRLADAITLTSIHGCLSESETNRARKRLVKMIKARRQVK